MAGIGSMNMTLADIVGSKDGKGNMLPVVELLSEVNGVLPTIPWIECNDGSGHKTVVRTGLPSGTWRTIYGAVQPSKSETAPVRDTTGMLADYSEIDATILDLSKDRNQTRLNESMAFIEGLGNTVESTIFYGNTTTDPKQFHGLAPRYGSKSAANATNIVDAAGTGSDNTSIWFIGWGPMTCHGIYPEGTMAGLKREDKGKQTKETSSGNYEIYREYFEWHCGISLRDWRSVVRICNIDVSDLTATGSTGADLIELMITAYHKQKMRNISMPRIYCNETIMTYLHKQSRNKSNVNLTVDNVEGKPLVSFLGIPILESSAITNAESRVV